MVKSVKKIEKKEANGLKNDYKNREETIDFTDEINLPGLSGPKSLA